MDDAPLDLEAKVRLLTGATMFTLRGEERIGLEPMAFSDGPTGVRGLDFTGGPLTCLFPNATLLASSWSMETAAEVGQLLAEEAERQHIHVVLGPTVNLHRSPARRPALRGLLRGPAADRPPRRGVRLRPAVAGHRRLREAPGRQRVRDRAARRRQRRGRADPARALPAAVRDRRRGRRPVVGDGGLQQRQRDPGDRARTGHQRDPQGRVGLARAADVRLVRDAVRRCRRQRRPRPGDARPDRAVGSRAGRGRAGRRGRRVRHRRPPRPTAAAGRAGRRDRRGPVVAERRARTRRRRTTRAADAARRLRA